jgi:uncharacterized protein YndB with AHSA1/START domain
MRLAPKQHERAEIHARPVDVWRIYVDPSRIPDWQTGSPVIEDISGAGDEPSTTYVSRRGRGTAQTTVLEAVRPRHLVTRTDAHLGLQLDLISELTSEGEGTLLYFCAVETVRELGGSALVDLDLDDSHLTLTVTAVDLNGRLAEGGQGVVDRVLAWDGTVIIDAQGVPARLRISFPQLPVTAQTAVNLSGPKADLAT